MGTVNRYPHGSYCTVINSPHAIIGCIRVIRANNYVGMNATNDIDVAVGINVETFPCQ